MNFKEFLQLNEDGNSTVNIASGDTGVGVLNKRIAMPQISPEMYMEFVNDLTLNNISYELDVDYLTKELTPTQSEFNDDKVNSIKQSIRNGTYEHSPILVTKDNHIVDGHHRWKAFNKNDTIRTNRVDMSFNELFEFLQNKPYIINRGINQ